MHDEVPWKISARLNDRFIHYLTFGVLWTLGVAFVHDIDDFRVVKRELRSVVRFSNGELVIWVSCQDSRPWYLIFGKGIWTVVHDWAVVVRHLRLNEVPHKSSRWRDCYYKPLTKRQRISRVSQRWYHLPRTWLYFYPRWMHIWRCQMHFPTWL